ncbi:hypothetical protein KQX54_021097, partial [Cotesia glomerata]
MKSSDERSDIYRWDNKVIEELKSNVVGFKDPINMFNLNGQLKIVRHYLKAIEDDVSRLSSLFLTSSKSDNKVNYCLHVWVLNWYFVNHYDSESQLKESNTNILKSDNIRQVFYDLILHLSDLEKREQNRYDYCKQYPSFHQGLYNLYRQVVVRSFQEFGVRYLSLVGQAICDAQSYHEELKQMEEILSDSLKTIMESTKEVLHNMTYYMYPCDPTYFENMNEETNLELEKMVQTVIIAENDLSTTHSCSHK